MCVLNSDVAAIYLFTNKLKILKQLKLQKYKLRLK